MAGAGASPIVNQGELRAASGGRVWLVGGEGGVRNEGLIAAPDGQVVLAAGRSVDLVDERLPHVAVRVSAPGTEVLNLGSIAAGGGRVDLLSAVVNQSGIVQADSMGAAGGVVRLEATESVQLGAGSVTRASGSAGGRVLIDAGPAGTMLAAGSVQAIGSAGQGGEVQMLGRHVGLTDAARSMPRVPPAADRCSWAAACRARTPACATPRRCTSAPTRPCAPMPPTAVTAAASSCGATRRRGPTARSARAVVPRAAMAASSRPPAAGWMRGRHRCAPMRRRVGGAVAAGPLQHRHRRRLR